MLFDIDSYDESLSNEGGISVLINRIFLRNVDSSLVGMTDHDYEFVNKALWILTNIRLSGNNKATNAIISPHETLVKIN